MWHLAIIPRETLRRASYRWNTRDFRKPRAVEIAVRDHRFTIQLNPANGYVDESIYADRMWAPELSAALCSLLPSGGTFVDVGANIGFVSLLAARIVGDRGRVVAFEPLPFLVEQLMRSGDANSMRNIDVRAFACGREPGSASLFVRSRNVGGSSLIGRADDSHEAHDVQIVRLDDQLRDESRIDVIKIDVEGLELDVLQGATAVIERHKPVLIIEFSPRLYERFRPGTSQGILQFFEERGYDFWTLDGLAIDMRQRARELSMRDRQQDILCRPRSLTGTKDARI